MSARPVLLLAGGTGGHVFPALAVATVLASRSVPVHWLGGSAGIEARVAPAAGIPFTALPGRGIRGSGIAPMLLGPPRLAAAVVRAWALIRRLRPRAAIGFGGYASGAGGVAAWLAHCPLLVHEQNAVAGFTNRVLARLAERVLTGFPGTLGARGEFVGNPVREEFARVPAPAERYPGRQGALRLLVVGGSQGAQILNRVVPLALARCAQRFEVQHLAGASHLETTRAAYAGTGIEARVESFSTEMAGVCARADLVVARAGALTLAELAAVGVPAILVPFPSAVDDHQTVNARVFVAAGAARLLPQSGLTPESLATVLDELAGAGRPALQDMAERARSLAQPDAAIRIVQAVLDAAGEAA